MSFRPRMAEIRSCLHMSVQRLIVHPVSHPISQGNKILGRGSTSGLGRVAQDEANDKGTVLK
jgi:hypothetical protein